MGKIGLPHFRIPDDLEPTEFRCITLQVPDDLQYIEDFRLMLEILSKWNNYERTGDDSGARASRVWRNVVNNVDWLGLCAGPELPEEDEGCFEISPFHPALTYWPNHPILSPNHKPNEYAEPAWQTGAGEIGLTGQDAWINNASISTPLIVTDLWEVGVPSITLSFEGAGEIDLTFVDAVQGGQVWIFPDGNFLVGHRVDLSHIDIADLADLSWFFDIIELLTGNPVNEVHDQVQFDTDGPHTLTMWFLPLGESPPYVGFGGGLRRVQLCGAITLSETVVMPYTIARSGCDIVLSLDGAPVSTIEDVFYTDAACEITDTTHIVSDQYEDFKALTLENRITSAPPDAVHQDFLVYDDLDAAYNTGRIRSGWSDRANRTATMQLYTMYQGAALLTAIVGATRGLHIVTSPTMGHSDGLLIQRGDSTYDTVRLMRARVGTQEILSLLARGTMTLSRVIESAGGTPTAFNIVAKAVGVTPSNNFGTSLAFSADNSAATEQSLATIEARWANATTASRSGRMNFRLYDYLGNTVPLSLVSIAGQSAISVHGNVPVFRQVVAGTDVVSAVNSFLLAMENYGWITDATAIVPLADDLAIGLGDRNLPPDTVGDQCLAANWLAGELYAYLADAFTQNEITDQEGLYNYFRAQHGWVLTNLLAWVAQVAPLSSGAAAVVLAEIVSSYPDFVPAIYSNLYDQAGLSAWVSSYSGYGTNTDNVLSTLIEAFAYPTWLELLFSGSLFGVENFTCDPCLEDPPSEGMDFSIDWDEETILDDFNNGACGIGLEFEDSCGGSLAANYLALAISVTGTIEWGVFEVTVAYNCENTLTLTGSIFDGNNSNLLPSTSIEGTGSFTLILTGSTLENVNGGTLTIRPRISAGTLLTADTFTVTHIRIEGVGNPPAHTAGSEC